MGNSSPKKDGIVGLTQNQIKEIKESIDEWKSQEVKIAIIGRSGTGKSTLINILRGLGPKDKNDPDYCKVGNTQCTLYNESGWSI